MKHLSFLIVCLFFLASVSPALAEYLQGTVVHVDRDKGEVEILLSAKGQCHLDGGNETVDQEDSSQAENQRRILVKAAWFPRCLEEGTQVYARGKFAADEADIFEAEDVFPCRKRGGHDPTGVRSRFQHHRRQMMWQRGGEKFGQ